MLVTDTNGSTSHLLNAEVATESKEEMEKITLRNGKFAIKD